ncbi:hypothetical protein KY289_037082 [Solanum tuberosum]|nr:hypothetical protein KY289_037082 [Solanum tuberosum]
MAIFSKPKPLFILFLILSLVIASQCDDQNPQGQHPQEKFRECQQEESNNSYLFESQRFKSPFRASHGDFRILEKFIQRSQLLQGIEKIRVAVLELEPQTFLVPHYCDGEIIFVVVRGQGTISIAEQDDKNSFNLEMGDVFRAPAGSIIYLINRDNKEKFFVYGLAKSSNAPGKLHEYFSAGLKIRNPSTEHSAVISWRVLLMDKLERLFELQKQGIVIKASEEQIRAISEHASQTKGKTLGPFNLLKEHPLFENKFGQFFEASPERFEQLKNLDISAAFMNINQGGMVLPYYNTRSTSLVMVVEGNARFEMACPHLGRQGRGQRPRGKRREQEQEQEQEQEGDVHYQKGCGNLKVGDVLVIPAGHPITFIATGGSNLRLVGFGINAQNNKKNFLAGKQNIWRNIDREAKELSFNMAGREVEKIFQKQDESYFVAGPEHRQQ